MTDPAAPYVIPTDTPAIGDLRTTLHQAGTAPRVALLVFAAELALETLPSSAWHDRGSYGLSLAAKVAAGEPVKPTMIVEAMQDENDDGPLVYMQLVPPGPEEQAWGAVSSALGYAAWQECARIGQHPNSLIEGYASPDALDFAVDTFVGIPGLDLDVLARATEWVRDHASKADEGWGRSLSVRDIQSAATYESTSLHASV